MKKCLIKMCRLSRHIYVVSYLGQPVHMCVYVCARARVCYTQCTHIQASFSFFLLVSRMQYKYIVLIFLGL